MHCSRSGRHVFWFLIIVVLSRVLRQTLFICPLEDLDNCPKPGRAGAASNRMGQVQIQAIRLGFTDDVILNSRYAHIGDVWFNSKRMCYLNGFSHPVGGRSTDPYFSLREMELEISMWKERSVQVCSVHGGERRCVVLYTWAGHGMEWKFW